MLGFFLDIPLAECIQCYKCTTVGPQPLQNETKRICSDFDHSERYIVDCPYSTFCMKKTFTVNLHTRKNYWLFNKSR